MWVRFKREPLAFLWALGFDCRASWINGSAAPWRTISTLLLSENAVKNSMQNVSKNTFKLTVPHTHNTCSCQCGDAATSVALDIQTWYSQQIDQWFQETIADDGALVNGCNYNNEKECGIWKTQIPSFVCTRGNIRNTYTNLVACYLRAVNHCRLTRSIQSKVAEGKGGRLQDFIIWGWQQVLQWLKHAVADRITH